MQDPVDTVVTMDIDTIQGLTPPERGPLMRVVVTATNMSSGQKRATLVRPVLDRNGVAIVRQPLRINLGTREGMLRLEVRALCQSSRQSVLCQASAAHDWAGA